MTDEETEETIDEAAPEATEVEAGIDAPEEEAAQASAEEPAADAPDEEEAEPEEVLSPKERRRRTRSAHSGEAAPQRTLEERLAERQAKRRHNSAQRRRWRSNSRERRKRTGVVTGEGTPPAERAGTGSPRVRQGVVVSDKGDKTITVRIDTARQHRVYGKIVRASSTLHAHDETNDANAGDTVRVVESRPLSATKRWRLVEVTERAR